MGWSYNRLWVKLINKGMNRSELREATGITTGTLAKLGKNQPVAMTVLGRICHALNCRLEDIVEYVPDPTEDQNN